ncbi:hypothetical protein GMRT_20151 [Giardia muris]|uniref:Uncharacterized protein n=1 Tax=Giardia muris TaxID=5742 RepID=A0A4Z1SX05_GIAMU|nr:hypothetical protein GMRT_20151 [Giardia muris]|eukprot:TNJ29375.1 hypothetical protein GMRT_20151 [Giardia muris]
MTNPANATTMNVASCFTGYISRVISSVSKVKDVVKKTEIGSLRGLLRPIERLERNYRDLLSKYVDTEQRGGDDEVEREKEKEESSELDCDDFECVLQPQYDRVVLYEFFGLRSKSSAVEPAQKRRW